LRNAAAGHAGAYNGYVWRLAIVSFQQHVFEQLKEADVYTCVWQDTALQAGSRTEHATACQETVLCLSACGLKLNRVQRLRLVTLTLLYASAVLLLTRHWLSSCTSSRVLKE
jgi:hypothetical protein